MSQFRPAAGESVRTDFAHLIGVRAVASGRTFDVINPATGRVYARCPDASREELDQAVEAARDASGRRLRPRADEGPSGIAGVRLPFLGVERLPDISTPAYRRLFRTIADLDWHVHLHVEAALIPELLAVLETAGPKLVIDHMGRPGPDDAVRGGWFRAIVGAVGRGRTWVKVSCAYRLGPSAEGHFHAFLEEADPERLFWASDCPFVGHEGEVRYEETIDWFARRIEDDETRRRVLGGNAHRFYFGLFRFLCG